MTWTPNLRSAFKIGCVLVLAAILNVATSWTICATSADHRQTMLKHPGWTTRRSVEIGGWTFAEQSRIGVRRAVAERRPDIVGSDGMAVPDGALPSWNSIRSLHAVPPVAASEVGTLIVLYEDWAFGWPFVALSFRYKDAGQRWPDASSAQIGAVHLPVRPLWGGILLNTAIYCFALWTLIEIARSIRDFARRRAGRCMTCAYPIGQAEQCPECGTPYRHRTARSAPTVLPRRRVTHPASRAPIRTQ